MFEFILPDLGEGIHEGEVLKWYVNVGDDINEDDPLLEVETDKAAVTIPSPRGGKVSALNGSVGDTIHVGNVVAVIDDGSGGALSAPSVAVEAEATTPVAPVVEAVAKVAVVHSAGRPVPAAPATRRLAREMGVDINLVPATGPAGRVTPEDVQKFASGEATPVSSDESTSVDDKQAVAKFAAHASTAIPFLDIEPLPDYSKEGPVEVEQLRSIRRKIAHKMTTTKILIPHVVHMDEADVTVLDQIRKQQKDMRESQPGGNLSLLPFVVKAVLAGLKQFPAFNASIDPFKEEVIYKKYYNIGIAVDSDRGLIVPVIKDADKLSVMELSAQIEELAMQARDGNINVSSLNGGTFTITNIGSIGGTGFSAAINYPESAILGLGRAQDKPVVRNGEVVIRKMLPMSMSFDHRIADGADAARLVTGIVNRLSDPNTLLMEI